MMKLGRFLDWRFRVIFAATSFGVALASVHASADQPASHLDVNDVSILFPPPKTAADVDALIAADEKNAGGTETFWPAGDFQTVLNHAQNLTLNDSAGKGHTITFGSFKDAFNNLHNWKVVGIRVDPSAPSASPDVIRIFGSSPQIRLIVQPVTLDAPNTVHVHDFTAHLVYNFTEPAGPAIPGGGLSPAKPDKQEFGNIVADLVALKAIADKAGVMTDGALSDHPALKAKVPEFQAKIRSILASHLKAGQLLAAAFMGVENQQEPWIFFAMNRDPASGKLATSSLPTLGGTATQMLIFGAGPSVVPASHPTNVNLQLGVSTASLFPDPTPDALKSTPFSDSPLPTLSDIPDLIANPRIAHFFNSDCISCHTESTRRKLLSLPPAAARFHYSPPKGISGVSPDKLPGSKWNVRNFGWGPDGQPTVSQRTANESADAADLINREYLANH
jgi:hypothetical protein